MASLFGVSAGDLEAKLVPAPGSIAFRIGEAAGDDLTTAAADAIIEAQEAMVESYLRHKYQVLLRRVEGEVVCRFAVEGQSAVTCGLVPVTAVHGVFVNFPRSRAWDDRRPSEALATSEYSVVLSTGVITLVEPLKENDRVWADYSHSAAATLLDLRHLVLNLAAVEVARRFAYFRSAEGFDRFEGWQSSSAGHLRDLGRTDGAQIGVFDRLALVNETKNLRLGEL